jgi:hypothetical protein
VEPYDSGPGRKWLFFLFGAVVFAFLLLRGVGAGNATVLQAARGLGVLAFGATAWRAHGLGVHADDRGLSVRTWRGNMSWAWSDVLDITGEARAPHVDLGDGTRVPLLDNWHADPEGVGAEVRRRLQANRRPLG